MARIVVTGYGTAGDMVPLLALGETLRDRGHEVLAAVNPWAVPLFRNAGLDATALGPRFGPEEAAAHHHLFDARGRWAAARHREAADLTDWPRHYRELAGACRTHGAELLVAGATLDPAGWLAEDLGIPWVRVFLSDAPPELPPLSVLPGDHPYLPLFLASGPPRRRAGSGLLTRTGFALPDDRAQPGWTEPTPELRAFLGPVGRPGAERPRRWREGPLVLLPGSTPLADPAAVAAAHVEAAGVLGRRLVVQGGWAGLGRGMLPADLAADHVFFADTLPHDWLLRRAAAAVLSGRPGTLARALRAGCPLLVEPRGRDAFANGARVLEMGVGAVLDPRRLSAETVRRMLEERVMLPLVQRRCRRVARRLAGGDGAAEACDALETWWKDRG